ncbi:Cof-type HAD-IIB family hydrolase [Paenibacillus tepidiphilus]|uniref:Cof-type HAD-IIB family hydrolase n=1 Tax=Paenibacillus tepidiphilus TaxID=2608683 RepID=UPI0013A52F12|nr:HAD family hydrolase [Paenibacillus tepidiphilus]
MIKLIASDLDGTLLDRQRNIAPEDWAAVKSAFEEGYIFCVASGRMHSEIMQLMTEYEGQYYTVGQNGATIYTKEKELVSHAAFAPEVSSGIMRTGKACEGLLHFVHCADDSYYTEERNADTQPVEARIMTECTANAQLVQDLESGKLVSCKISFFGELETLLELDAELRRTFSGQIETFTSEKDVLDIMPLNVNKGTGLQHLMDALGLAPQEIACIGDSFNDLSMFALTEHSYVMAGAHPDVKSSASHVVRSVAEAITHIHAHNREEQACG